MGPAVSHFIYILTEHQRCYWTDARKLLNDAHESTVVYLACPKTPLRFKHFTFFHSNKKTNNITTSPQYTSARHKTTHLPTNSTPRPYSVTHRSDPRFQNISCINDWVYPLNRCSAGMALSSLSLPLSKRTKHRSRRSFRTEDAFFGGSIR